MRNEYAQQQNAQQQNVPCNVAPVPMLTALLKRFEADLCELQTQAVKLDSATDRLGGATLTSAEVCGEHGPAPCSSDVCSQFSSGLDALTRVISRIAGSNARLDGLV